MKRAISAICGTAAALAMGCAEPRSVPVIGPDGSRMLHVSCGGDEARCFELAGRACPMGYELLSTAGRNFLVRCRAAGTVASLSPGIGDSAATRDGALAPSPYVIVPPPNTQALAPNPYRPGPAPGSTSVPPHSTATFPPLGPPAPRGTGQDVGY